MFSSLLITLALRTTPVIAEIIAEPVVQEVSAQTVPELDETSTSSVKAFITREAEKKGVDVERVLRIADCESSFTPQQSKIIKNGIQEPSYGVFQFHLPSNPNITEAMALDVEVSTKLALELMSQGKWYLWSCDKQLNI